MKPTREQLENILQSWVDFGAITAFEIEGLENGTLVCHTKGKPDRELRGRSWDFKRQVWIVEDKPFKHICLGSWTMVPASIVMAVGTKHKKGDKQRD